MTAREFPAITLWQPWASLIFANVKRHETRAFPLPERLIGPWVAIHAAKRQPYGSDLGPSLHQLCCRSFGAAYARDLPRGAVVGLVRFGPPRLTQHSTPDYGDEVAGDWSPNRWAWPILEAVALPEPVPAQGRQLWWRIALEAPPDLRDVPNPTQGARQ